MSSVKWLIEEFSRDNSFEELGKEAQRQGHDVEFIRYEPFESGTYNVWPGEQCVVFQGSINLARQLQREKQWIPGPIANWKNFLCRVYYTHYGQFLLNSNYQMMPFKEFMRRKNQLFEHFGGSMFVRPDGGEKSFTGQVVNESTSANMWKFFESECPAHELVAVSTERPIDREWRFICTDKGEVITGSRYKTHGRSDYQAEFPPEALTKAQEILSTGWYPDKVFALDICRAGDKYYLMEIGAFSVAGLYKCDLTKLVKEVSLIAREEFLSMR